jgi:predicted regulator of Ras-like GTPase activity (Roadblock/LC7/MglB family)
MPFGEVLGKIVTAAPGGIGAVLVDSDGETIDLYTRGDGFQLRLAGAHHSIILSLIEQALIRSGNGNSLGWLSIRSDRFTFTIMPVQEGIFVVLMQDSDGITSQGLKVLRDAIPGITHLI